MISKENGQYKVDSRFLFELVRFLLPVVFLAGIAYVSFETKSGADEKYVKKEVFQVTQERYKSDMEDVKVLLRSINEKLDQHVENHNKGK